MIGGEEKEEEHRRLVPMDGAYGVRSRDHMECLFACMPRDLAILASLLVVLLSLARVWLPALPPIRPSWAMKNVFGCKQRGLSRIGTNFEAPHSLACWQVVSSEPD